MIYMICFVGSWEDSSTSTPSPATPPSLPLHLLHCLLPSPLQWSTGRSYSLPQQEHQMLIRRRSTPIDRVNVEKWGASGMEWPRVRGERCRRGGWRVFGSGAFPSFSAKILHCERLQFAYRTLVQRLNVLLNGVLTEIIFYGIRNSRAKSPTIRKSS